MSFKENTLRGIFKSFQIVLSHTAAAVVVIMSCIGFKMCCNVMYCRRLIVEKTTRSHNRLRCAFNVHRNFKL